MTVGVFTESARRVAVSVADACALRATFTFTAQTSQKHRDGTNEAVFVCSRDHQLSAHLSTARADSQKAEAGQAPVIRGASAAQSAPPPATALRGPHSVSRGDETT